MLSSISIENFELAFEALNENKLKDTRIIKNTWGSITTGILCIEYDYLKERALKIV